MADVLDAARGPTSAEAGAGATPPPSIYHEQQFELNCNLHAANMIMGSEFFSHEDFAVRSRLMKKSCEKEGKFHVSVGLAALAEHGLHAVLGQERSRRWSFFPNTDWQVGNHFNRHNRHDCRPDHYCCHSPMYACTHSPSLKPENSL